MLASALDVPVVRGDAVAAGLRITSQLASWRGIDSDGSCASSSEVRPRNANLMPSQLPALCLRPGSRIRSAASLAAHCSRSTITASCRARNGFDSGSGREMIRIVTLSPSETDGSVGPGQAGPLATALQRLVGGEQSGRLRGRRGAVCRRGRFDASMSTSIREGSQVQPRGADSGVARHV